MATKEKAEKDIALQEVEKADEKVNAIKAERKAKVEARCAKRDNWKGPFKLLGKVVNAYDREPGKMWGATVVGGGIGGLIVLGVQEGIKHFGNKTDDATEETEEVVEETAPFDTEA